MNHSDVIRVPDDRGPDDQRPESQDSKAQPQAQGQKQSEPQPEPRAEQPPAGPVDQPAEPAPEAALDPAEPPVEPEAPAPPLPRADDREGLAMVWESLQAAIQRRVQREQFETWFRRAALVRVDDQVVVIAVPNAFSRSWLEDYYRPTIEQAMQGVLGVTLRLQILVDPEFLAQAGIPEGRGPADPAALPESGDEPQGHSAAGVERVSRDMPPPSAAIASNGRTPGGLLTNSDVVLNPKYTFHNFVVGPCNRFGHAAAMGAAEQPGKSYNPFFLHGNVGVGKTHLLQGVCYMILERDPESRILYLSCETFVNHFISALENGDLTKFRNKYRNVDVLVVDDIHLLANKDRTQEEFFHTFNTLYNAGKQIVLSSDSPPKEIPTLQDRLVSRFKWGMVTEIEPPCFETRMAIIKRKSRDSGIEFPDDVVALIAEHVEDNVRELEGAVTRLAGFAGLTGTPVTLQSAREALTDLFKVRRGAPTMDDIITVITDHYGVKQVDLQGKRRHKAIAYPRQIAMFLARHITRHSLEEIGAYFGGRDHSTVLYAVDKINKKAGADSACKGELDELLGRLGGKPLEA